MSTGLNRTQYNKLAIKAEKTYNIELNMAEALRTNGAEFSVQTEAEPISERFFLPQADIITVSGPHHTFKTAAAEVVTGRSKDPRNGNIQRQFRIRGIELTEVGRWIRNAVERQTGRPFEDSLMDYSAGLDALIDAEQEKTMRGARIPQLVINPSNGDMSYKTEKPVMVEGRYSGFLGAKVSNELFGRGRKYAPKIERVLFYSSDPQALVKDAAERYLKDNPGSGLTLDELMEIEINRELKIVRKAQATWPKDIMGQDIYDPDMVTPDGKPVYTIKIDVAGKTPHQIFEEFFMGLLARQAIVQIKKSDFSDTEAGLEALHKIRSLSRCQGLIQQYHCNRYGEKTIDVYIGDYLNDQIPVCIEHAGNIKKRERQRFASSFNYGINFSQNGFPPNENSIQS